MANGADELVAGALRGESEQRSQRFLGKLRIVFQNLLSGPSLGQQVEQELHGQYEDTDIFVDKADILQAVQGQRRAADSGCWWSIASIIGSVSDSSRLAPVNEAS